MQFGCLAIAWLKSASQYSAADLQRLGWDQMHGIEERAVAHGIECRAAETFHHGGVCKRAFRKGRDHVTLVNDL